MRLTSCEDRDTLDRLVAGWIDTAMTASLGPGSRGAASSGARALGTRGGGAVALAVGASTLPAYRLLTVPPRPGTAVLTLDELVPAPARPECAFAEQLRAVLPPAWRGAVRPFDPERWPAGEVGRFLAEAGGLALAVCGLGPDGHIAFNQPPDDGGSRIRIVALARPNLARLGDVAPAEGAFTLGLGTIREAGRVALVVAGDGKEAAFRRLVDGPAGPDCPASWLAGHPNLDVFSLSPSSESHSPGWSPHRGRERQN
jgi:glucosamine-6-phosphate deaminase